MSFDIEVVVPVWRRGCVVRWLKRSISFFSFFGRGVGFETVVVDWDGRRRRGMVEVDWPGRSGLESWIDFGACFGPGLCCWLFCCPPFCFESCSSCPPSVVPLVDGPAAAGAPVCSFCAARLACFSAFALFLSSAGLSLASSAGGCAAFSPVGCG